MFNLHASGPVQIAYTVHVLKAARVRVVAGAQEGAPLGDFPAPWGPLKGSKGFRMGLGLRVFRV